MHMNAGMTPEQYQRLSELFAAACGDERQPLAVQRDFDVVRIFHAPHEIERVPPEPQLDGVLAVERKGVMYENSAAGPWRQPFDMLVLRQIRPYAVNGRTRRDVEVADGEPADVPCGR